MKDTQNPYATALDGLELPDPVQAFFDFCIERERIRIRRSSGLPSPWSEDPIFQQGRFLNVFREDDRGTKSILRFIKPVAEDVDSLVHAVFFARWCNRDSSIDGLEYSDLNQGAALRRRLVTLPVQPWCNVTAYPVEPIVWRGRRYSRLEAVVELFPNIRRDLASIIEDANGDVVEATNAINFHFQMQNDFPIFMAVMDVAWFRPDLIDPASHVPTGIGAAPFLDRLQKHLGLTDHHQTCDEMISLQKTFWPEAKRGLEPIDVEYLSCECRKYFSYRNGTKQFEGKNRFRPGENPRIEFDVATSSPERIESQIHVIAGGPCSGKTTLLQELKQLGYQVEGETAEVLLREGVERGITAEEMRSDPVRWQQDILMKDYALFERLPVDQPIFTDTSVVEDIVFSRRAGIDIGPNTMEWLQNKRFAKVFFLEPLDTHEVTRVRTEPQALARKISAEVELEYQRHGYTLIRVPAGTLADRVQYVLRCLDLAKP